MFKCILQIFFVGVAFVTVDRVFAQVADNNIHKYGEKVIYGLNKKLQFPDFSLKFVGKRWVKYDIPHGGFTYYDFELGSKQGKQKLSWTSGTGAIAPEEFVSNEKRYKLELAGSVTLGNLAENEIVVWDMGRAFCEQAPVYKTTPHPH